MTRTKALTATTLLTAGIALTGFAGHADAWHSCTPRRGATYYSVTCQGTGRFRAVAGCYDADGRFITQDYANAANAPYGISDDYCPFGTTPKSITIVSW